MYVRSKDTLLLEINMKDSSIPWETQMEELCLQLQRQNHDYRDPTTKAARNTALECIAQSIRVLKQYPHKAHSPWGVMRIIRSLFHPLLLFHLLIVGYIGLLPHASFYTCSSLIRHNYLQFDFIGTPSLLKAATCIGFSHASIMRHQTWKGWNLSHYHLYHDGRTIINHGHWAVDSVWYGYTHSLSESTKIFLGWLNRKTHVLWILRDIFIELPVIKEVRAAAKAVEETMEEYVYEPVRRKAVEIGQCVFDGVFSFVNHLIQWGRPELGEDRNSLM